MYVSMNMYYVFLSISKATVFIALVFFNFVTTTVTVKA